MTDIEQGEDCVSKKSWSEVLSRSLKLFTFNAAREGGKSFGRVLFYVIVGAVLLFVATYMIDSITGWFGGWFDFWPFKSAADVSDAGENSRWFNWGAEDAAESVSSPVVEGVESAPKWYCKWNPIC